MDAHLRDLRYYVAVAEELSFTNAARRLHISQPALSRQIKQLEQTVRAPLIHRSRGGIQLTLAGQSLLADARKLLADWDESVQRVAEARAQDSHELLVGIQTAVGRSLYRAVTEELSAVAPGWSLILDAVEWTDPSVGLLTGRTDVALAWLPLPAGLTHRVLTSEARWVAMATDNPLARQEVIRFGQLLDEPVIALPFEAGAARDFWLATAERNGRPARIAAEVTTPDATFEAVASGAGIHLLAAGNAEIYARPGIVCRPVHDLSPCYLVVGWRKGDDRRTVRAFVEACSAATLRRTPSE